MKNFLVLIVAFIAGCGGGGGEISKSWSSAATVNVQGVVTAASSISAPEHEASYAVASGRVAVAGAVVEIAGTDKSSTTDADGFFSISGVAPGSQILIVKKTGSDGKVYAFLEVIEVPTGNGPSSIYDIGEAALAISGGIKGNAKMEGKTDHTGISVFIPGTDYKAYTDQDGNFAMNGVPAGTFTVDFQATDFITKTVSSVSVDPGATAAVPDVVIQADVHTGSVSGYAYLIDVTDQSDIVVTIGSQSVNVNKDGSYSITGISQGSYFMSIAYKGLTGTGSITGKAVYSDGRADNSGISYNLQFIPGYTPQTVNTTVLNGLNSIIQDITLLKPTGGMLLPGGSSSPVTGPDGVFKMDGIPTGTYSYSHSWTLADTYKYDLIIGTITGTYYLDLNATYPSIVVSKDKVFDVGTITVYPVK